MDYILTSACMLIGFLLLILEKVTGLRKKYPVFGFKKIWSTFISEEWDSMMVCFVVWLGYELFLVICHQNEVVFHRWFDLWGMYAIAAALGYSGLRLAYKAFKTTEKRLSKEMDKINDSNG